MMKVTIGNYVALEVDKFLYLIDIVLLSSKEVEIFWVHHKKSKGSSLMSYIICILYYSMMVLRAKIVKTDHC